MKVELRVVRGQPQGKRLLFPQGEFLFGRGTECHVRPNSDWVSRQHCLLMVGAQAVSIRDLGSTNGTLVNGARLVGEQPLTTGDQIQVGPLVFEVRLDDTTSALEPAPTPFPPVKPPTEPSTETAEMPHLASESTISSSSAQTATVDIRNLFPSDRKNDRAP